MNNDHPPDDQDLLARAQSFDEIALAEIFDRYYVPLYRYIYHFVGHTETAEDLAAEVFHRLIAQLHQRSGPKHALKSWLYRVAHNLVIDEARRPLPRRETALGEDIPAAKPGLDEQAEQNILATHARCALGRLTPGQRSIVILKFIEGLDNAEIARIVDLPIGAVKSLQHRAIHALRRALAASGQSLSEEEPA